MKRKWKHWAVCAGIVVASAASARLLSNFRFFDLLNLKSQDIHFVVRGPSPTSNIVLITADQQALNTFPEPIMFWHPYYAEAIQAAAESGAKVIGLDAAFGIPVDKWVPDYDRMLAGAVASSPVPVICGYVPALNENQKQWPIQINMMAAALGLDAFANLYLDPDEFVRRQELIEEPSKNPKDPPPARSIAMRMAEKYLGADATFENGKLMLNGQPIPISAADRSLTIDFAGPPDTFPTISLARFIAAARAGQKQQLRQWVGGKAVLIGLDLADQDKFPTPFYSSFSPKWLTAGVEIHANTLRTLLEHRYILPVPEWVRLAGLLMASLVTVVIVIAFGTGPALAWGTVELTLMLAGTHLLFRFGRILYTSELLVAAMVGLIGAIVYRFSTAEKRRDLFRRAVSLFVGKELAGSIDTTEDIQLSGKRSNVTILFTDIRGFTAFSEKLCDEQGPEALVKLLNVYMSQMVAIIVRYHGQVNKFIGDGILAIFSDEDEGAVPGDHAIRAVRCATEIVTAPNQFSTGSGIHTGIGIVGNVGSADKMEYTVLGDTVNLASRLESLNKEHHTKLLMSEATQVALNNQVDTVHLAAVPVRGKTAPINLFTVASLVEPSKAVVNA